MTDITIKQGTDSGYSWPILNSSGQPLSLTGYKVRAQVRTLNGNLLHTWTTELGNAVIVANAIYILWTSTQTAAWKWSIGRYDVELISPQNTVARIDSGTINISKEITK